MTVPDIEALSCFRAVPFLLRGRVNAHAGPVDLG